MSVKSHKRRGKMPGFNVIGYVSEKKGIALICRNFIRLLLDKGYPLKIYDLTADSLSATREKNLYEKYSVDHIRDLPYRINFFIFPVPNATQFLFSELADLISRPGSFNVYLPIWELGVLPDIWVKAVSSCDLIVAFSDFVRSTIRKYFPKKPVVLAEQPLYLPSTSKMHRSLKLPKASTIFIFSFEPRSDVQRKNPFAVIRAFKLAFKTAADVALVIKINDVHKDLKNNPNIKAIRRICANDNRIRMMTSSIAYADALNLYRCCDVFVSLHRSEGLGLGPMEAMMLGKPVIATAWSGNMSYMNARCACLVNYKFIAANGDWPFYRKEIMGKKARWAEPSIRHAAQWMRRLALNPDLRRRLGKASVRAMATYQTRAKNGLFIKKILSHYQSWKLKKDGDGKILRDTDFCEAAKKKPLTVSDAVSIRQNCSQAVAGSTERLRGLKIALKIDPSNSVSQHHLSLLYHKSRQTNLARYHAQKILDMVSRTKACLEGKACHKK
jgi:glycosyltransferase involved in cell wall biosynthesis